MTIVNIFGHQSIGIRHWRLAVSTKSKMWDTYTDAIVSMPWKSPAALAASTHGSAKNYQRNIQIH